MNEGWLRFRLDDLKFPYTTLHNADIAAPAGPLRNNFDVIILPSNTPNSIKDGSTSSSVPPEYRGGIGQAGYRAGATVRQLALAEALDPQASAAPSPITAT